MCYWLTHNKHKIYPGRISSEDICLDDIAHHLTNINRYGGALPLGCTYSVAQHSMALADYVFEKTRDHEYAAMALLHDASEAYLGDLVSCIKPLLKDYKELESLVQNTIYTKYNIRLPEVFHDKLSEWDKSIVLDEVLMLMPDRYGYYKESTQTEPLGVNIKRQASPEETKRDFLFKCREYGIIRCIAIRYIDSPRANQAIDAVLKRIRRDRAKATKASDKR